MSKSHKTQEFLSFFLFFALLLLNFFYFCHPPILQLTDILYTPVQPAGYWWVLGLQIIRLFKNYLLRKILQYLSLDHWDRIINKKYFCDKKYFSRFAMSPPQNTYITALWLASVAVHSSEGQFRTKQQQLMFAEDLEIARLTWGPGKIASFAGKLIYQIDTKNSSSAPCVYNVITANQLSTRLWECTFKKQLKTIFMDFY